MFRLPELSIWVNMTMYCTSIFIQGNCWDIISINVIVVRFQVGRSLSFLRIFYWRIKLNACIHVYENPQKVCVWTMGLRWPFRAFGLLCLECKQVMLIYIQYSCTMLYNKDRFIIMFEIQVCKLYDLVKVVHP